MGSDKPKEAIAAVNEDPAVEDEGREMHPYGLKEEGSAEHTFDDDDRERRPPLPPRPNTIGLLGGSNALSKTLQIPRRPSRPQLQSTATTALQLTDIQTYSKSDGSRATYAQSAISTPSRRSSRYNSPAGHPRKSYNGSEENDSTSIRSFAPAVGLGDVEAILGEVLSPEEHGLMYNFWDGEGRAAEPIDHEATSDFSTEFDELEDIDADGSNEGKKR